MSRPKILGVGHHEANCLLISLMDESRTRKTTTLLLRALVVKKVVLESFTTSDFFAASRHFKSLRSSATCF